MLEILSTALPGLRDLRGPVIAGYLWLLFGWLLIRPDLDRRPTEPLAASIYELGDELGQIGLLVAVSVAAYLIGAVSQEVSRVVRRAAQLFAAPIRDFWALDDADNAIMDLWEMGASARDSIRRVRQQHEALGDDRLEYLDDQAFDPLYAEVATRQDQAESALRQELGLPATLLVGDRPELFGEVDRLRAEGELRLAVVPPLLGLDVLLAIEGSAWWLCGIALVALLLAQGIARDSDARKLIADAMQVGRVASSGTVQFREYTEELPARVREAVDQALEPWDERSEAGRDNARRARALREVRDEVKKNISIVRRAATEGQFWRATDDSPRLKAWKRHREVLRTEPAINAAWDDAIATETELDRLLTRRSLRLFTRNRRVRPDDRVPVVLERLERLDAILGTAIAERSGREPSA